MAASKNPAAGRPRASAKKVARSAMRKSKGGGIAPPSPPGGPVPVPYPNIAKAGTTGNYIA